VASHCPACAVREFAPAARRALSERRGPPQRIHGARFGASLSGSSTRSMYSRSGRNSPQLRHFHPFWPLTSAGSHLCEWNRRRRTFRMSQTIQPRRLRAETLLGELSLELAPLPLVLLKQLGRRLPRDGLGHRKRGQDAPLELDVGPVLRPRRPGPLPPGAQRPRRDPAGPPRVGETGTGRELGDQGRPELRGQSPPTPTLATFCRFHRGDSSTLSPRPPSLQGCRRPGGRGGGPGPRARVATLGRLN
jgi:hypothetical protein